MMNLTAATLPTRPFMHRRPDESMDPAPRNLDPIDLRLRWQPLLLHSHEALKHMESGDVPITLLAPSSTLSITGRALRSFDEDDHLEISWLEGTGSPSGSEVEQLNTYLPPRLVRTADKRKRSCRGYLPDHDDFCSEPPAVIRCSGIERADSVYVKDRASAVLWSDASDGIRVMWFQAALFGDVTVASSDQQTQFMISTSGLTTAVHVGAGHESTYDLTIAPESVSFTGSSHQDQKPSSASPPSFEYTSYMPLAYARIVDEAGRSIEPLGDLAYVGLSDLRDQAEQGSDALRQQFPFGTMHIARSGVAQVVQITVVTPVVIMPHATPREGVNKPEKASSGRLPVAMTLSPHRLLDFARSVYHHINAIPALWYTCLFALLSRQSVLAVMAIRRRAPAAADSASAIKLPTLGSHLSVLSVMLWCALCGGLLSWNSHGLSFRDVVELPGWMRPFAPAALAKFTAFHDAALPAHARPAAVTLAPPLLLVESAFTALASLLALLLVEKLFTALLSAAGAVGRCARCTAKRGLLSLIIFAMTSVLITIWISGLDSGISMLMQTSLSFVTVSFGSWSLISLMTLYALRKPEVRTYCFVCTI